MARGPEGPPAKQAKTEPVALPANVIAQFQNDAGELVGENSQHHVSFIQEHWRGQPVSLCRL